MKGKYDDIINLPHHVSKDRPRMSIGDRAAQFGAFAALTGYDGQIKETARLTEEDVALTEYQYRILNEKMAYIVAHREEHPLVGVRYFVPDKRKNGGSYEEYRGRVWKIKEYEKEMVFEDGTCIPIREIKELHLELENFQNFPNF